MRNIFIFFFVLAVTQHALAGKRLDADLGPAQQALAAGDHQNAYALFSRHAEDSPLAQFTLGLFHREGWGRPRDESQACRRFEQAARGNIPAAQQVFGDCLAEGVGRAADGEMAEAWYRKAAANGIPYALCSAGGLYIEGKGVTRDVRRGLALCAQAAQAGSPPAMLRLADYFRKGADVPKDLAAARYWYQQAAERHVREAQYHFGIMLSEGQGGNPDPSAALFWLETAASEGYDPAYLPTAILYASAEPDPNTGALAPAHLAKIYLWSSAAKARAMDPTQLTEISRIEAMVLAVMPASWKPELDEKVAEHLRKYGGR